MKPMDVLPIFARSLGALPAVGATALPAKLKRNG